MINPATSSQAAPSAGPSSGPATPSVSQILADIKSGKTSLGGPFAAQPTQADASPSVTEPSPTPSSPAMFDVEQFMNGQDSDSEQADASNPAPDAVEQLSSSSPSTIEVEVGEKGRRKTISVNLADTNKIKTIVQKQHEYHAGMRKFQAERDSVKKELQALKSDFDKLESIYKTQGVKGLVATLSKDGSNAWEAAVEAHLQEKERLELMDPVERYKWEQSQAQAAHEARERAMQEKYEAQLQSLQENQERAETKALVNKGWQSISRYGFAGKLNNPQLEQTLNKAVWDKSMAVLNEIPADKEITQAMIDREFRAQYSLLSKGLTGEVKAQTRKVLDHSKAQATHAAQSAVRKGQAPAQAQELQQFKANIRSGNVTDALKAFLTGKVKL